jgi:hypothetical protein
VQPSQQLHHGIEQAIGGQTAPRGREQRPVGDGVVEEPGHEYGVEVSGSIHDNPEHLDRRDADLAEAAQQPVLAPRQPFIELFDCVDLTAVGHKSHHMA